MRRLMITLALAGSTPALAQQFPPPQPRQDQGDRILREEMEKARERLLRQQTPHVATPAVPAPAAAPAAAGDGGAQDPAAVEERAPMFRIERIEVEGGELLPSSVLERRLGPFRGLALGAVRIGLLLQGLNKDLIDAGFITSRAYALGQNLAGGVLSLRIVPGRIEAIRYNGHPFVVEAWADAGLRLALPMGVDDILQLRDIEQGLDQLNRVRGRQAQVRILPGEMPGASVLDIVDPPAASAWRPWLGMDNQGSRSTGSRRLRLGLEAGDLAGFNETFNLGYTGSIETNALNAGLSLPWGYNTFSMLATWSEYQSLIGNVALLYGTSTNYAAAWNRLLYRDQDSKIGGDLALSLREARREINNVGLVPQRLTVLRAGVNRLSRFDAAAGSGQWTVDGGLSRGLEAFGAMSDVGSSAGPAARSRFSKLDVSASVVLNLPGSWSLRGNGAAQWSGVPLFSSEQIFVGGVASVRGFAESAQAGDRGGYWRSELARGFAMAAFGTPWQVEPFGFWDAGHVRMLASGRAATLMSTGLGLRLAGRAGSFEAIAGRPVVKPADMPDAAFRLNLALTLFF
ncbi:ShlB/FhaC/HecB family hemolysin secretion/activation protein [Zoogloea dura]|uniref:ShlB/FhaC/HecB family hemolysin secretion/activation protein n=1 Tax=Zoogloea dura TaxID=2728840 RepID=A0A848G116_9RHOO|nr:ShlB/FhaC/HecB family hemolysin secretion/activation protein [Zoogloea dura]NML24932.1 ShlB/FhaC/HecB family hemolysin secretion/activation protein [Zoogloea dura]